MPRLALSTERPRVVVITSASSGVGRAAACAFARRGDSVGLIAPSVEGLESVQREIDELGGLSVMAPCDIANATQVEAAADAIEKSLGPIEVWVNNSTASLMASAEELTPEVVRRVTEVTYLGAVHGTMSALRRMRARDSGTILQVGSARAYRAIPVLAAYSGAKHALRGFTISLRAELVQEQSQVRLAMMQLPALQPDAAADMIVYSALITRRRRDRDRPRSA
jgi:short-subunit dehydrogenase